jgi:hypothetical protein
MKRRVVSPDPRKPGTQENVLRVSEAIRAGMRGKAGETLA